MARQSPITPNSATESDASPIRQHLSPNSPDPLGNGLSDSPDRAPASPPAAFTTEMKTDAVFLTHTGSNSALGAVMATHNASSNADSSVHTAGQPMAVQFGSTGLDSSSVSHPASPPVGAVVMP